jgi:hypothetical protein
MQLMDSLRLSEHPSLLIHNLPHLQQKQFIAMAIQDPESLNLLIV